MFARATKIFIDMPQILSMASKGVKSMIYDDHKLVNAPMRHWAVCLDVSAKVTQIRRMERLVACAVVQSDAS